MKKNFFYFFYFFIAGPIVLGFSTSVCAKITWNMQEGITLEDKPLDIAISTDGLTYILCEKSIAVYSPREKKITDTIPIIDKFSQIALTPDGGHLLLTNTAKKLVSIIEISQVYNIEIGQSPIIGKTDAPIHIFAFIDYQCPYCARVYPVLEQLLNKYPDKVNLVIKHYPLKSHQAARKAAMAALAAASQGKYNEISSSFMANYSKLNDELIKKYAEEIGLDMQTFDSDSKNPVFNSIINRDFAIGSQVKVRGVPTIFINGKRSQKNSLENFTEMIEKELKEIK